MGSNVSTQPCPGEKKKDELVTDPDFTVSCIHGRTSPGCFSEPFEIVPAKEEQYKERITIDWTGGNPPAEITSDNIGNAKANPYKFEKPYNLETQGVGNNFLSLLSAGWTYMNKDVSKIHIPGKGDLTVITYNPTSWSIEITFPLPTDKAKKQKGGYKWDKDRTGETTYKQTSELQTRNDITKYTQTDKTNAGASSTTVEKTVVNKNTYSAITAEDKKTLDKNTGTYTESSTVNVKTIESGKKELRVTDVNYVDGNLVAGGTSKKKKDEAMAAKKLAVAPAHPLLNRVGITNTAPFFNKVGISIKKDNSPWTCDVFSIINTGFTIYQKIEDFKKILEDIPKIGWYFDWELEVLQGSLSASWGWKEYTNHRAYFALSLDGKIKLIGLKGELGFGVSGFSIKIQAFASIGGSITLGLNGTNNKPLKEENLLAVSCTIEGEIEFAVGARFEALYMVKMEATIKSGIKATGEMKNDNTTVVNELAVNISMKFTGLTANVQASVDAGASIGTKNKVQHLKDIEEPKSKKQIAAQDRIKAANKITKGYEDTANENAAAFAVANSSASASKSVELIKPFNFYEKSWPEKELPVGEQDCSKEQIQQIIGDILLDKYFDAWKWSRSAIIIAKPASEEEIEHRKFLFWNISKSDYITEVSTDDIAAQLTAVLIETPFIRKSKKAVEAIALATRKEFEAITAANVEAISMVRYSDYEHFLKAGYPEILNNNIDQAKAMMAANK